MGKRFKVSMPRAIQISFLSALMIGGLFFFGCQKQEKSPDLNGVLNISLGAEPGNLNPILYTDASSGKVADLIFSGLFKVNEDLELEPDLATTYNVSEDGKVYTIKLNKNVFWHDGTLFTARDVKFTFDKILDPSTQTVRRSNFLIKGEPIKFEIVDDYTIKAILPEAFAPFLFKISIGILPEHLLKDKDINTAEFNRTPIGTGPFLFNRWDAGQHIILNRNSNFYRGAPRLQNIVFRVLPDTNTATLAIEKGEVDITSLQPKDYKRMIKKSHIRVENYDNLHYSYIGFNLRREPFNDIRVRKALTHAISKDALVKNIFKGFATPAYLPSSPVSWAYPKDTKELYPYDPDSAKSLLKEAGYTLNIETGFVEKDGSPLEFTLITSKGSQTGEKTAEVVQQFFKNIGVKMDLQLMEWQSFVSILNDPKPNKRFGAVLLSWSLGLDPDSFSIWHSSQYPKGFNFVGYSNPKVDELLVKGRTDHDIETRKRVYAELCTTIAEDAPYIFLTHSQSIVGVNRRVNGLSKPGPAGLLNSVENVFITQ